MNRVPNCPDGGTDKYRGKHAEIPTHDRFKSSHLLVLHSADAPIHGQPDHTSNLHALDEHLPTQQDRESPMSYGIGFIMLLSRSRAHCVVPCPMLPEVGSESGKPLSARLIPANCFKRQYAQDPAVVTTATVATAWAAFPRNSNKSRPVGSSTLTGSPPAYKYL